MDKESYFVSLNVKAVQFSGKKPCRKLSHLPLDALHAFQTWNANSEFRQQDGQKEKDRKTLVCDKRDRAITCAFVVIVT